jgi:hypothetical protein
MTTGDLRCDHCGRFIAGPAEGVRFVHHPGVPQLRDDTGLACLTCWDTLTAGLGSTGSGVCAVCGAPAPRRESLHLRPFTGTASWRLCAAHAAGFLNALRTTQPKLDPGAFRFPAAGPSD